MTSRRLLFAVIGIAIGFIASFLWTRGYNSNNAGAVVTTGASSQGARSGGDNQQAMMAQIRETMEKAKQNPNDPEAQIEAAGAYDQIGRTKEAVEHLKKAIEINPTDRRAFAMTAYIGNYHLQLKEYVEAEKWFRKASEINPNVPDAFVELAATFLERQPPVPDEAIRHLQRALGVNAKDAHALEHLIEAYLMKKDSKGADEALYRLQQADSANKRLSQFQTAVSDLKAGRPVTIPKE
jgi:tetratricopeptide (TPR) repeat protein